jgi:hypothetical protein
VAGEIGSLVALNLDYLGTKSSQEHGGVWSRPYPAEISYPYTFQRKIIIHSSLLLLYRSQALKTLKLFR